MKDMRKNAKILIQIFDKYLDKYFENNSTKRKE